MKIVSDNLKNALNKPTTQRKGRILVNGNYYDVYNVEYYADCYDEGNVIGNAIASQLDFDLPYMPRFNTFKYFDGVWTGNEYEYVDFGTFTVFDEKDQDEFNKHITAFDNLIKFNAPFIDKQDYPKTLYEELVNICEQAEVELENLSIPNGDFIVENNQFVGGENLKTVLKAICGISGNYAIIKDNKVKLQLRNETDVIIKKSHHKPMTWKRRSYGFNQLIIGMKDVEGEYSIRQDENDIAINGVHKLVINDNPLAYTQDKREELIDELFAQIKGFGYTPYELEGEWLNYLDIGDTIDLEGLKTIVLRINGKSPKSLESLMSAPAIIDSAIEYSENTSDIKNVLRNTQIIVNKHEGQITQITSSVEQTTSIVKDLENSVDYFSVDLSQYTLTIPTNSMQKPLETRNYDINYYGYYKGKQVVPNVSISGNNEGITTSTTSTYIRFAVDVNSIISNLTNNYTITFTYDSPSGAYTLTKKVSITLSIQGKDGTSVNILGSYNSLEELKQAHPTGNVGDAYIVQGDMYVWSIEENTWVDVGNIQGPAGTNGKDGEDGKSSYQIWLEQGNVGSEQDYLDSLKGKDGQNGQNGQDGKDGKDGINGTNGKDGKDGTNGSDGKSAYQIWLDAGNTGTEADYLESLKGKDGVDGKDGKDGTNGTNGTNGKDGTSTYFYVRYSANSNGNPMTQAPTTTTKYMGVASTTSPTAPTSYSAYTWSLIKGEDGKNGQDGKDGEQGIQGLPGADGTSSYLHIKYSDDGKTFTANNGETVGRYRGELVDNNPNDSLVFSDYTWYDMSLIVDEELEEIRQDVKENTALIEETNEQIRLEVAENYTSKGTFDEFKQTTETELSIQSNELTISVSSIQERLDILGTNIDGTTGEVTSVKTGKGFTFNDEGLNINDPNEEFNTQITNRATQYKNGDEVITETSKDGFMTTDLKEKGTHQYSYNGDTYDFVAERIEVDGEYAYAHFYNGGDL